MINEEIAKIIHDYIERGIGCDYDILNSPPPPIPIRPVKVKSLKERLEENKMKATSVQNIKNVKDVCFSIENNPLERESKLTIVASTDDDIFAFEFEGSDLLQSCKRFGLFTGWEKDQKIRELEEKLSSWKKEASDCLRLRDEVRREKNKEINKLKQQLQQAENDKKRLTYKLQENEKLKEELVRENEKNIKRFDCLNRKFNRVMNENLPKTPITDIMLVDDHLRLTEENEKLKQENKNLNKCINALKSDLDLERAANEAQRKFIKEYAGNDTEVTFNYAIGSGPITYGLYDHDYIDKLRKEIHDLIAENTELKTKLHDTAKEGDEEPSSRSDILDLAKKCVCGKREQDYGTPESNFQLIADLWNQYLFKEPGAKEVFGIGPMDVAMMMGLMKIARIRNGGGSGDSFVDLAGYAACGGEIWHSNQETNIDSN